MVGVLPLGESADSTVAMVRGASLLAGDRFTEAYRCRFADPPEGANVGHGVLNAYASVSSKEQLITCYSRKGLVDMCRL